MLLFVLHVTIRNTVYYRKKIIFCLGEERHLLRYEIGKRFMWIMTHKVRIFASFFSQQIL